MIDRDIDQALKQFDASQYGDYDGSSVEEKIVSIVKAVGYVILPGAISDEVLTTMRTEFRSIIDAGNGDFYAVDRHDGAVCVRIKPFFKMNYSRQYPAIFSFYNSGIFRSITKKFYADCDRGSDYLTEIFVHETPETQEPLSDKLHWDRAQTLKFWIYIDDLPEEAGPMLIEPQSSERNKNLRITEHAQKGKLVGGVDNVVATTVKPPIALTAPAGSIMIHDTDASHGASKVLPGHVRRIIRGHCRARP